MVHQCASVGRYVDCKNTHGTNTVNFATIVIFSKLALDRNMQHLDSSQHKTSYLREWYGQRPCHVSGGVVSSLWRRRAGIKRASSLWVFCGQSETCFFFPST